MDIKSLLDQLLQSGKEIAQKGQVLAEQKLGIPAEGEKRDSMLSGIKTGAAAAGTLALLLGTQTGRRVTGAAVKVGSLAALGSLAYQMYRRWETPNTASNPPKAITEAQTDPAILLTAMIAAAKADGHVDSAEMTAIREKLSELALSGDVNDMILKEITKPLDAKSVAALANGNVAVATEIYLISAAIIDVANDAERAYLNDLRVALGLPDDI